MGAFELTRSKLRGGRAFCIFEAPLLPNNNRPSQVQAPQEAGTPKSRPRLAWPGRIRRLILTPGVVITQPRLRARSSQRAEEEEANAVLKDRLSVCPETCPPLLLLTFLNARRPVFLFFYFLNFCLFVVSPIKFSSVSVSKHLGDRVFQESLGRCQGHLAGRACSSSGLGGAQGSGP